MTDYERIAVALGLPKDAAMTSILSHIDEMRDQLHWLQCLESAGVDNWGGYDFARDIYNGDEE